MKKSQISIFLILIYFLVIRSLNGQGLLINEIMSSNRSTLIDRFESTPDWIEIYNNSASQINLSSYYLSDDKSNLSKWRCPDVILHPDEYYLLFASSRDVTVEASSWETVIDRGVNWRYFLGNQEPPQQWKDINFNDSGWMSGMSGIGYGDGDDETIIDPVISLYLRKEFIISDLDNITYLMFNIDFDDGYVAYINGHEISRENLGEPGEFIPYDRTTDNYLEANLYQGVKLKSIIIDDIYSVLSTGKNVLSVQVHNFNNTSSDLTAIPFLTTGYRSGSSPKYIAFEIEPLIPRSHTNFSISNGNESLFLSNVGNEIVDSVGSLFIPNDISYGRKLNEISSWLFYDESTPGRGNTTLGYIGALSSPEVNIPSGFYSNSISIELDEMIENVQTYYSIDGSDPTPNSSQYKSPILLNKTTILKLKSYSNNFLPSPTHSSTYFIDENKELPIISLSTDPLNLWDHYEGIYVLGPNAESNFPYFNANFWQEWERPATFEFFDTDSHRKINQEVIIKIFGGWSRGNEQKSLSIFSTNNKRLMHEFFPQLDINSYRSIVLRNSGNDWNSTMMRDGFIHSLADDLNIDNLAYQPSILYLNGEYWGIHNIREKLNLNYIISHHDIEKENISLLELNGNVIDGTNDNYFEMIDFLNRNSLENDNNYEVIKNYIDINSFIDYQLLEIYIANTDWPGNNVKYWRENSVDGKWRWILFDTDFGFNWIYAEDYRHNTLQFALEENGPEWPNPPWSTFIFRKLLENKSFREAFINRYADLTNTTFLASNVKKEISKIVEEIKNEILPHSNKWKIFSITEWVNNINTMKRFADFRVGYLDNYFRERFGFGSRVNIKLNISNNNSGKIKINSVVPQEYPWNGEYFANTEIQLIAIPNPGYKFSGWSGISNAKSDTISVEIEYQLEITANYVKIPDHPNLVINEINYNSSTSFDTEDWIEIYNNSNQVYDISGWKLKDDDDENVFIFPDNLTISNDNYLIICRDSVSFRKYYGGNVKIVGDFGFGLSNSGDLIRIIDKDGQLIDSVRYADVDPWPPNPDGEGSTLELINPELDNSFAGNWKSSAEYGTPGAKNDNYIVSVDQLNEEIPISFKLYQNFPNPFNPFSIIKYQLPQNSRILLEIFDVQGQHIKTLVDKDQRSGYYEILWNGTNSNNNKVSSGVYFYRISVRASSTSNKHTFMDTKKMLLLK